MGGRSERCAEHPRTCPVDWRGVARRKSSIVVMPLFAGSKRLKKGVN